jgi:xanthine dehydrogenase molybdopterin-binding subunit B
MMGLGWLKTEDLTWDESGAKERGTWEYKVPMHLDIPKKFSVYLTSDAPEFEKLRNHNYPMSSKAAGEAAMALSLSYKNALQNCIEAFNPKAEMCRLPMTPKNVFKTLAISKDDLKLQNILEIQHVPNVQL